MTRFITRRSNDVNQSDQIIKEIAISDCVHYCGFRYGGNNYNPYETYVLNKKNNVPSAANRQEFINFLKYYRPENMAEALSLTLKKPTPCWIYPWQNISKVTFETKTNWVNDPDSVPDILTYFSPKGILSFRIEQEFYWLERALESIMASGYQPVQYSYVHALMMISRTNECAYLLLDGNHRVSALFALGYKSVTVRIKNSDIIKEESIDSWPGVVNGFFYKEDALKIFLQYFKGNSNYFKSKNPGQIIPSASYYYTNKFQR